jgi:hypothetical protein
MAACGPTQDAVPAAPADALSGQGVQPGIVPQPADPIDPGLSRLGMRQGRTTLFAAKPPSEEIQVTPPGVRAVIVHPEEQRP